VDQLAYALITPYSLLKSRTGGIIGRLTAHARLTLVGVRMFVWSDEFIDQYRDIVVRPGTEPVISEAWRRYIDENLRRDNPWGFLPRTMLLLFSGPDAVRHLKDDVIGSFSEQLAGDTVRGTYGDFIRDADGHIRYFEPAVITAADPEQNVQHLRLLAKYADADGGVLTGRCTYPAGSKVETCLVILKPDNFERPTRRPGKIIDVFSRTGLRIVGTRLFNMTVAQAEEFYGPLKDFFRTRLRPNVVQEVYGRLHDAFSFPFTMIDAERVADFLADRNAVAEFNKIVEYMTGVNPEEVSDPAIKQIASRTKCLAMLYEGPDAVSKIRRYLGSTDPTKAEAATVRSEFGRDLMRNGAHASDSAQSAERERKIVGMWQEDGQSDVRKTIESYLGGIGV
jgi:nucleoside diphosphate kinase